MQAARLRLFTALPKLSKICDNAEFYFRLSLSLCRRAMATEYTRLRNQSYGEVSLSDPDSYPDYNPRYDPYAYHDEEDIFNDVQEDARFLWEDTQFEERERALMLDQALSHTYNGAKRYLIQVYHIPNLQTAAVLMLLSQLDGREVSTILLHKAFGVKNHQEIGEFVNYSIRKTINETFVA